MHSIEPRARSSRRRRSLCAALTLVLALGSGAVASASSAPPSGSEPGDTSQPEAPTTTAPATTEPATTEAPPTEPSPGEPPASGPTASEPIETSATSTQPSASEPASPEPGADPAVPSEPMAQEIGAPDAEPSETVVADVALAESVVALDEGLIAPLAGGTLAEIEKTAAVPGGGAVRPGMEFTYQLYVACTSIEVDCVDFVFTDVIPEGLEVVQVPQSTPTRTVNFDAATRTLTMTYVQPLTNPVGETGWRSGSNEAFDIVVRLPVDTPLETGDEIDNVGIVSIDGAENVRDDATVEIEVPATLTPVASKQWPGGNVIAGSDAATTATIGAANASSGSAEVTSLAVTDSSAATWEHFDLTSVNLVALPSGATQAQLFVCTAAGSTCGDGDWVAAGTVTAPGPMSVPGDPAAVTGVRVVFTAGGSALPRAPQDGGSVALGLRLRDTLRSTGGTIAPASPITVSNCATSTVSEATGAPVASAPACANKQILSSTVAAAATKSWVPDTNGNWQTDGGEYAVAGALSPATARVRATNQSAVPVHQIVITEPGPGATNFADFDVDRIRLTLPAGATEARVQVSYADGTTTDNTYVTSQAVALDASATQVTGVTVTYSGGTADAPTIGAGATAGLDLHGRLTAAVATAGSLTNCAAVSVTGAAGTTAVSQTPCGNLPVQAPNVSGQGVKNVSQRTVPADQPVSFTMRLTNNGNLSLVNPVLTDPADPAASPNPFDSLVLVAANSSSSQSGLSRAIEVTTDGGATWSAYAVPVPAAVNGVRVRVDGELAPTAWMQLNLTVERRDGVGDDVTIENCFAVHVDNSDSALALGNGACASVTSGDAAPAATVAKDIAATELPEWTPGLERQETEVTLRIANTGNLSSRLLQITDVDTDFFDAVDFTGFGPMVAPAGANRITIDAFVGGAWVTGVPTAIGAPSLPGGVTAPQVRGLRFTFTSTDTTTNGGYALAPCAGGVATGCAGVVRFDVSPRPSLVSDPGSAPPSPVSDIVTGSYLTLVDDPGSPPSTPPATDSFELVPGDPRIDVEKGPENTVLGPGSLATQTIRVTNSGDAPLTDVSLVDVLPDGLAFDERFEGVDGPYEVVVSGLPDGYHPAPAPAFELTRDGERISSVRWTFGGWALPPNGTITITFQIGLEPGVITGQTLTNTMGATGDTGDPDRPLACTPPDGVVSGDERFGDGVYCTDTAGTRVIAGAAFQARKWVAGDADLGWWHPSLGFVPTGGGNCPSAEIGGRLYTATPCVALVRRGGQYDYVVRVVNAGTEPAMRMALIDNLPVQGDSGVLGATRGTQWDNRPTLAGPATYAGPGTGSIGYSSAAPGTWCTDDLYLAGPGCAGGWEDGAGASTTALRLLADFGGAPLNPGAGIEIHFVMNVPEQIAQDSDVTIAWNSFAHAEATQTAQGGSRVLPPIEPIKVGVSPMLPDPVVPPTAPPPPPASTTTPTTSTTSTSVPATVPPTTPVPDSVPAPASSPTTPEWAVGAELPQTR